MSKGMQTFFLEKQKTSHHASGMHYKQAASGAQIKEDKRVYIYIYIFDKKNAKQRNMRSIISPSRLHSAFCATFLEALNNSILLHVLNGDMVDLGYCMLHTYDKMMPLTPFFSISWGQFHIQLQVWWISR